MANAERLVLCPLDAAAIKRPDVPAVVGPDGILSFRELDRRVTAAASRLRESGCTTGTRVGLYLPRDERYVVLLLALLRAGAVACPLSTRIPVRGVAPLLQTAGCRALISDEDFSSVPSDIEKLRPEELLEDSLTKDSSKSREPLSLAPDQASTIVFTSGSTGRPKAALHSFGNHYYNALGSNENIPLDAKRGDRWLLSLPLYHVGGISILFRCLVAGAAMVLPEPDAPLGEIIAGRGITHVSLVATQLRRLLAEKNALDGLKSILLGGSGIPAHLLEEAAARNLPVHTSYGLTEMTSQVTTTSGSSSGELRTSGRVLPHREITVSEDGEILVRGDTLFAGYVEGGAINRPLDADGWFHTRDLGTLDTDDCLRVHGRRDNLFISGGENIQPEEIEAALIRIEGVEQAVVVPVPDAEFGFRPVAFVRAPDSVAPEDLRRALEPILPRFKIPTNFYPWPESVPEGMKIDRTFFQERARRMIPK